MRLALGLLLAAAPALADRGVSVRRVGPLLDASGNRAHVLGQDEAYTVSLGKSVLWLYGDTFYGRRKPDGTPDVEGAVSNSSALTLDDAAADGITAFMPLVDARDNPRPVLPYDEDEDSATLRLWPGHGLKLGDKIYLYYSLIKTGGKGQWDFRHAGQGLAVGADPHDSFTRVKWQDRYDLWTSSQPRFGIAVIQGDGWVYVFGRDEGKPNALRLARVKPELIEDPGSYEYLASASTAAWTTELSSAAALFENAPPETSVSFNRYLGQYLMLYSRFLERDVVIRTAARPWGPWTRERVIYRCRPGEKGCYAAKEHPEYAGGGGRRVYFTLVDGDDTGGVPELFEATFRPKPPPTAVGARQPKTNEHKRHH